MRKTGGSADSFDVVEFFGQFQIGIADGLAVYRNRQVLLVNGERVVVALAVKNACLAVFNRIGRGGVDAIIDSSADGGRILLATADFEAQAIAVAQQDGAVGKAVQFKPETDGEASREIRKLGQHSPRDSR